MFQVNCGKVICRPSGQSFLLKIVFFKFACCKDPFKAIFKIILFSRSFNQRMHYIDTERFEILSFEGTP